MAVPSYTTDLTTLAIGDLGTETWDESSDAAYDDGGSMVDDANLYYNGASCVSAQFTKDGIGSIILDYGSGITVPTDGAILIHHLWAAPLALGTLALGGVRILSGDSFGDFYGWPCSGSDAPPSPRGGWTNYALNPAIGSPAYTVGSPTGVYSVFGIAVSATAQARGNPNACNAIRYGRCTSIYEHGEVDDYATFDGYATKDALIDNKWNLLDKIKKSTYELQGLMSLGTASNPVDFRDSNVSILIADTINVTSGFTKIEVNNANSNIEWTAVNLTALGTNCKGSFEAIDNATIHKKACVFTDDDYFIYQSNSLLEENTTYRRCGLVTQNGATFTSCIFDEPSGLIGISVDSLNLLTKSSFTSDGTGHAVDLGTISSDQSVTWDNTDSGYTAASSGNETILVSVDNGITLTINVTDTATTPTVYNTGTGTVNVVAGQKTFAFTVSPSITGYEWRLYNVTTKGSLDGSSELAGEETATVDNQSYAYSYISDKIFALQIIDDNYEEFIKYYDQKNESQSITTNLDTEENI